MKPCRSNQTNQALTLLEVLVSVAMVAILAAILLYVLAQPEHREDRLECVNNLKQIGLAYQIWAEDNNHLYPMQASVTNDGITNLLREGVPPLQLAAWNFRIMSNILVTPKILHCPADEQTIAASSFTNGLGNTNISYFVGMEANENYPQMILSGDDNLQIGDVPVKSGLLNLTTNTSIGWTERHHKSGNIGLADGSAQQLTSFGLQHALQQTGTNFTRLAIP
jgi:prepilin-type N-terminal cleavage/methylation domain-containing protein